MDEKSFVWRIWLAVSLTTAGVLYYLVFLFYLAGGVPIEKIHYFMTDGWPNLAADNVPLIAPLFLFVGLYFWYSYVQKKKPKPVAEPEYAFQFKTVEKKENPVFDEEYVFEGKAAKKATQAPTTTTPLEEED